VKKDKGEMKLRVRLAFLKRMADAMESLAHRNNMDTFVAYNTRQQIRRLRFERPAKRRARKWTRK
jgi:hypothetical protein